MGIDRRRRRLLGLWGCLLVAGGLTLASVLTHRDLGPAPADTAYIDAADVILDTPFAGPAAPSLDDYSFDEYFGHPPPEARGCSVAGRVWDDTPTTLRVTLIVRSCRDLYDARDLQWLEYRQDLKGFGVVSGPPLVDGAFQGVAGSFLADPPGADQVLELRRGKVFVSVNAFVANTRQERVGDVVRAVASRQADRVDGEFGPGAPSLPRLAEQVAVGVIGNLMLVTLLNSAYQALSRVLVPRPAGASDDPERPIRRRMVFRVRRRVRWARAAQAVVVLVALAVLSQGALADHVRTRGWCYLVALALFGAAHWFPVLAVRGFVRRGARDTRVTGGAVAGLLLTASGIAAISAGLQVYGDGPQQLDLAGYSFTPGMREAAGMPRGLLAYTIMAWGTLLLAVSWPLYRRSRRRPSGEPSSAPILLVSSRSLESATIRASQVTRRGLLAHARLSSKEQFDDFVGRVLNQVAPTAVLRLPETGTYAGDSAARPEWAQELRILAERAEMVVVCGLAESVYDTVSQAIGVLEQAGALDRAVFVVPPVRHQLSRLGFDLVSGAEFKTRFAPVARHVEEALAFAGPAAQPDVWLSGRRSEPDYLEMLHEAYAVVRERAATQPVQPDPVGPALHRSPSRAEQLAVAPSEPPSEQPTAQSSPGSTWVALLGCVVLLGLLLHIVFLVGGPTAGRDPAKILERTLVAEGAADPGFVLKESSRRSVLLDVTSPNGWSRCASAYRLWASRTDPADAIELEVTLCQSDGHLLRVQTATLDRWRRDGLAQEIVTFGGGPMTVARSAPAGAEAAVLFRQNNRLVMVRSRHGQVTPARIAALRRIAEQQSAALSGRPEPVKPLIEGTFLPRRMASILSTLAFLVAGVSVLYTVVLGPRLRHGSFLPVRSDRWAHQRFTDGSVDVKWLRRVLGIRNAVRRMCAAVALICLFGYLPPMDPVKAVTVTVISAVALSLRAVLGSRAVERLLVSWTARGASAHDRAARSASRSVAATTLSVRSVRVAALFELGRFGRFLVGLCGWIFLVAGAGLWELPNRVPTGQLGTIDTGLLRDTWWVLAFGAIPLRLLSIDAFVLGLVVLWVHRTLPRWFEPVADRLDPDVSRVLYLRNFGDDDLRMRGWWGLVALARLQTFDALVGEVLAPAGRIDRLARPVDGRPGDEDWLDSVKVMLDRADLVAVGALPEGESGGLRQELELLYRRARVRDVILVLPPVEDKAVERRWEHFRTQFYKVVDADPDGPDACVVRALSSLDPGEALLAVFDGERWRPITASRRSVGAYRAAALVATGLLGRRSDPGNPDPARAAPARAVS